MKTVDARGKLCPVPLIMTKKALTEMSENETLEVLLDNDTSAKNVTRMLEEFRMSVSLTKNGNIFKLTVTKTGEVPENSHAEDFCEIENQEISNYVIAFQRNTLGEGNADLGIILLKAFVNTLPEVNAKPRKMVFLNAGIFLAINDSPVLEALKTLENMGTEILVCGTCLDFYEKKNELAVGKVSNMYDILEVLATAGSVLYP
ncbi:MAG: sulfurtransferase-like selenium metabolism protein YedF [Bacteroidetes bacterium HGW-Bacteroidetes-21]|jgi:selenium metabolism protein YedF|nr:MAG: sulfurtransferase-like selenium metabolism protein YedF [Bacteroidetes bacterium HGW-Bacteroidetes-21]